MGRTKNQVTMGKRTRATVNEEEEVEEVERSVAASGDEAHVSKKQKKKAELTKKLEELRQLGYDQLKSAGLDQPVTEGIGDCWLISILAHHELDPQFIKGLTQNERVLHLNPWRKKVVEFMTSVEGKQEMHPKLYGRALDQDTFELFAKMLVGEEIGATTVAQLMDKRKKMLRVLTPWQKARHFGVGQQAIHTAMGLMLQCNILEIDVAMPVTFGMGKHHHPLNPPSHAAHGSTIACRASGSKVLRVVAHGLGGQAREAQAQERGGRGEQCR